MASLAVAAAVVVVVIGGLGRVCGRGIGSGSVGSLNGLGLGFA